MANALKDLEKPLKEIFVDKLPPLPKKAKTLIVTYLPWLNLAAGIFTLFSAYTLWHWANVADGLAESVNRFNELYGLNAPVVERLTTVLWLSLIVLVVEAVIYIAAFPATRARQKKGWDLLFLALLVNVVYGVVIMFTSYGGANNLIGSLVSTAIGLYFLFQIREEYMGKTDKSEK